VTTKYLRWVCVDLDVRSVANANVRKLRLKKVCFDPRAVLYEIDDLHACSDKLSRMNSQTADAAIGGSLNPGIGETNSGNRHTRGFSGDLCVQACVFRIEGCTLLYGSRDCRATARDCGFGPHEFCSAALKSGLGGVTARLDLLELLASRSPFRE
jgi:hypothetical protein